MSLKVFVKTLISAALFVAFNPALKGDEWQTLPPQGQLPIQAGHVAATRVGQNKIWALLKNSPGNEYIRIYLADSLTPSQGSWSSLWTPATRRAHSVQIAWDTIESCVHVVYLKQAKTPKHMRYNITSQAWML